MEITLIFKESAKGPLKHWTSDWKTKQACLKDARGNALRVIAILTKEEVEAYGNMSWLDALQLDKKRDQAEYCRQVLMPNILEAQYKENERLENIARLDEIKAKFEETGSMTWEAYCFVKHATSDLWEEKMFELYGKGECAANCSEWDEDLTEEEIEDQKAKRGAAALIENEMDNCGDINKGKGDMKLEFEWAYDRYKK
jgi:hypothetical protein